MSMALAVFFKVLVVAACGAVATFGGSPVVTLLFRRVDGARDDADEEQAPGVQAAAASLRGGHWIGVLERLAIFATVLAGFAEGVAVVLAVKGLARYPELRATTPGAAERFIIGTLSSALFAAAFAGLAWWLIGLW